MADGSPQPLSWRDWRWPLVLGLAARLGCVTLLYGLTPFFNDAGDYHREALAMLEHWPGNLPYYWPPGAGYLLALVYGLFEPSLALGRALCLLLSLACVPLALALARRLALPRRAVLATGWVAALYPPLLFMAGQPFSSLPTAVYLLVLAWAMSVYLAENRPGPLVLAGFMLGAGGLTRPSMVPLLGLAWLAVAWAVWRRRAPGERPAASLGRGALDLACLTLPVLLLLAPVFWLNHQGGAGWTLSVNNERNFFLGNNPYTPLYKTSHLASQKLDSLPPATADYLRQIYGARPHSPETRAAMQREALSYIKAHPGATLLRTFNRLRAFWGFDYQLSAETAKLRAWPAWKAGLMLAGEAGGYVLVMLLALIGLALIGRGWPAMVLPLLLVLGYQAPYLLAFAAPTYHFPVIPLLFPLAGLALARLTESPVGVWRELRGRWAPLLAVLAFLYIQIEFAFFLWLHRG